jgi:hypothetical protein
MRKYKHLHQTNTTQLAKYMSVKWSIEDINREQGLCYCHLPPPGNDNVSSCEQKICHLLLILGSKHKYEHMATASLGVSTLALPNLRHHFMNAFKLEG